MSEAIEFVAVGEQKYPVIKVGRAQAEQVVRITRWLSRHGARAIKEMQTDPNVNVAGLGGVEVLGKFVETLDADALIDLFYALIGCSKEEAELYFDIATLIEVAVEVYERQTSVRRLIDRFFSSGSSKSTTEEPSTTSE